jgi:2-polyprenyl-3-methyl-5-hydroxy-6-metoxy-1,4-benzoquinol methylase
VAKFARIIGEECSMSANPGEKISDEFRSGRRFRFGKNWKSFLKTVDEKSIREAERRLIAFLGVSSLSGTSFLDVGSGSGLHSLAARRLGADVVSFDYDPDSVDATRALRNKFGFDKDTWRIETGSVLDSDYLSSLGQFDVVYSWGVLHHTGAMWDALERVQPLVKPGGKLYIAIYNDLGDVSRWWAERKKRYCEMPRIIRPLYFLKVYLPIELKAMGATGTLRSGKISKLQREFPKWLEQWREYKQHRGMSRMHDMIDWIGGYPYEFAKAEDLVAFYQKAGFALEKLAESDGTGNNELVFVKGAAH